MLSYKKQLWLLFCVLPFFAVSQDFNEYQPLRSSGEIPEAFLVSSSNKYEEASANVSNNENLRNQKIQKNFHLQSNFVLDELLQSGNVIFNDPINEYVKKVADIILKEEPELRAELKFYTIKSSRVNAFATDRGEIFVNVGLIANLKNEAELAFILCHEIQHYVKRHNLNSFIEFDKIQRGSGIYKKQKSYDRLVSKHSYSRTLETEADDLGVKLYLQTNYDIEKIAGVFDILALTHVPYGNKPFDYSYLEVGAIQFEDKLKLDTINEIRKIYGSEDDEEAELSTHPSVDKRKTDVTKQLEKESNEGRKQFLVSEEIFHQVKKIAHFELCDILVTNRSYAAAIYHCFLLSDEHPNNTYLQKTTAKALYGLAQYSNDGRYKELSTRPDSIQGEMQRVFYLLNELEKEELNVLAARYMFDLHLRFPDDKGLKLSTKDMVEDVVIYGIEDAPEDYFLKEMPKNPELDTTLNPAEREKAIKLPSFAKYAFIGLWDNEDFNKMINDGAKYKKKMEAEDNNQYLFDDFFDAGEGVSLGIDNLLFINPIYLKVDVRKKNSMQYVFSENRQEQFKGWIEKYSEKLDLNSRVLSFDHLNTQMKATDYNEIIAINNWISEFLDHDMFMICSNYNEVLPITEKYGSSKFVYTGMYSARLPKIALARTFNLFYFLLPHTAPLGVSYYFRPNVESMYFTAVFDFDKHETLMKDINYIDIPDKEAVIKSNLYWTLLQMKKKIIFMLFLVFTKQEQRK